MTRHLLPFNYIVQESRLTGEWGNHRRDPGLRPSELMQSVARSDETGPRINHFSDKAYNDINFVVDMPVRLDDDLIREAGLPIENWTGRISNGGVSSRRP